MCIHTKSKLLCVMLSHDTPTSILLCVTHLQECTLYYYACIDTNFKLLCVMLAMIHLQECVHNQSICIHTHITQITQINA